MQLFMLWIRKTKVVSVEQLVEANRQALEAADLLGGEHDARHEGLAVHRVVADGQHLAEAAEVFDEVEASPVMQDLWVAYQKKFSYASDLGWNTVMAAVRQLFARCEGTA